MAVDPEGQFETPEKVARVRLKIIGEIAAALKAQGVNNPKASELDELVSIRTWSGPCYEFSHFSDEELADGMSNAM